ncbi:hypothetical protein [Frankia sp. QA3]|uniref:hypothetical protein n=1 Tax=Frankia sp. QA3 TaxID=710111 RepID=UPI000566639B|nr:hypothetical protein [Frankia sp. QA3]
MWEQLGLPRRVVSHLTGTGRIDTCWSMPLDRLRDEAPAAVQLLELRALRGNGAFHGVGGGQILPGGT